MFYCFCLIFKLHIVTRYNFELQIFNYNSKKKFTSMYIGKKLSTMLNVTLNQQYGTLPK